MKSLPSSSPNADRTTVVFTAFLILAGFALLVTCNLGVLAPEQLGKLWPITLVAAGLVELLRWREREEEQ